MADEETYGDAIPQEIGEEQDDGQPQALTDLEEILADEDAEEAAEVIEEEAGSSGIKGIAERILTRIPRPKALMVTRKSGPSEESEGGKAAKKRAVRLQTLTYDEEADEYTLTDEATYFEDLPAEAVHVTGKKNRYFLDRVEDPDYSDPQGIRATDLYLWMVNNSINDALAVKTKGLGELDIRRYLVIGIGAIIGVCVIYAMI